MFLKDTLLKILCFTAHQFTSCFTVHQFTFLFSLPSCRICDIPEIEESERFYSSLPCGVRLIFALYNLMESQSEMFCYFVIILNHMVSASLLTLFLPILIFLWAMLSVPRPTKRFWMTAIIYTQVSIFTTAAADVLNDWVNHNVFSGQLC